MSMPDPPAGTGAMFQERAMFRMCTIARIPGMRCIVPCSGSGHVMDQAMCWIGR
jgi:hypothetical protein